MNQNSLPKLPLNPTGIDRIHHALALLSHYSKSVFALCIIKDYSHVRYAADTFVGDDKNKMMQRAKIILKTEKLIARINANVIESGHAFLIKHNGQCIAIIILSEPMTAPQIAQLQLPFSFVPVKETVSNEKAKKTNIPSQTSSTSATQELSKDVKRALRYARQPI